MKLLTLFIILILLISCDKAKRKSIIVVLPNNAKISVLDTANLYRVNDSVCIYKLIKVGLDSDWHLETDGNMLDTFITDKDYCILYKIGKVGVIQNNPRNQSSL